MMKNILTTVIASCLLGLAGGCTGSETAPLEIEGVRAAITYNIDIIEAGINGEDIFLASQPVGEQFTMDNNVATRYSSEWTDRGVGAFRNFWNRVFNSDANIQFTIEVTGLELSGDIATVYCSTDYTSQRPDIVPPEVRVATDDDFLQFERVAGEWLLRRWEVQPQPLEEEEAGEGEGEGEGEGGAEGA